MPRRKKSNEPEAPARVFISATSKDLGTVRELVKQALLTMGCMPVEQSNFPPDYRRVRDIIEHKIAGCEAVIHIVGRRYGTEPDPATVPEGTARRSYTQLEADIARQLGKKLYFFVCPEDFPYDQAVAEGEKLQALQDAYRAEISRTETVRTEVADREDVSRKVRELQFELEKLKVTLGHDRRRYTLLVAGLIMVLALVAGGVFYVAREVAGTHRQVNKIERSTRENLEAVGAELISLQKQLAQAGQSLSDMKPEAIYKQLSARLGMSEGEIASLIAIGKHSKDLSEQAAAALAALEFGRAESLYVQAAASQEQNFLKAARDFMGAARAASLDSRIAEAIDHLERADGAVAAAGGREKNLEIWFDIHDAWVTALWQHGSRTDPAQGMASLRKALEMMREMLAKILRTSAPHQWAATQNNLGIALRELGTRSGGDESAQYLKQSVAAYRAALEVYAREQLPQQWAAIQCNLGTGLAELGMRSGGDESAQYLKQSVAAYRAALEVYTREQLPQDWADTKNNLGNTLQELGMRSGGKERAQYLKQSVAAYRAALEVRTREQWPQDWAATQNNLGSALRELGTRSGGEESGQYLEQSVAAYRAALEVYTRDQLPQDWAMTQNNLGNTLQKLGAWSGGGERAQYLKQSVAAYRAALEVRTREQLPQLWAETKNNLGNTLQELGTRSGGGEAKRYLQEAIQAYSEALIILTPEVNAYGNELTRRNLERAQEALNKTSL